MKLKFRKGDKTIIVDDMGLGIKSLMTKNRYHGIGFDDELFKLTLKKNGETWYLLPRPNYYVSRKGEIKALPADLTEFRSSNLPWEARKIYSFTVRSIASMAFKERPWMYFELPNCTFIGRWAFEDSQGADVYVNRSCSYNDKHMGATIRPYY